MPLPTTTYTWATGSNYNTSLGPTGSAWHNTPTKLTPLATYLDQGFTPTEVLPAQDLNYMLNSHGQWIDWHEEVLGDHGGYIAGILNTFTSTTIATGSYEGIAFIPEYTSAGVASWYSLSTVYLGSRVAQAHAVMPLNHHIPSGSTIQRIEVVIDPATAMATQANRQHAMIYQHTFGPLTTTQIGSTVFADTTGNEQTLVFSGLNLRLTSSNQNFMVRCVASMSGAVAADGIRGCRVMYTRPWRI